MKNQPDLQGVYQLLVYQLILTITLGCIFWFFIDRQAAVSIYLGGAVCIVPTACFSYILFQYQGAKAAKKIVNAFYKGEAVKFFLTIVLFAIVFKWIKIYPLLFFTAYIVAQLVYWFAPFIFVNKGPKSDRDGIKH